MSPRYTRFAGFVWLILMAVLCLAAITNNKARRLIAPLAAIVVVPMTVDEKKQRLIFLQGIIAQRRTDTEAMWAENARAGRVETLEEQAQCLIWKTEREAAIVSFRELEASMREEGSYTSNIPYDDPARGNTQDGGVVPFAQSTALTIGERFMRAEQTKAYVEGGALGTSQRVKMGSFFPRKRSLITSTAYGPAAAQALVTPDRRATIDAAWEYRLVMRDIVTNGVTTSNAVDWIRETVVNNADEVAEAIALNDGSGAAPESNIVWTPDIANVRDVKHFVGTTRNALMDIPSAEARIDNFLLKGIDQKLEDRMVGGSGAPHYTGILNTGAGPGGAGGIGLQAWDVDLFRTMRKAKTKVEVDGNAVPNAYLISPSVSESIDLQQDGNDRYYAIGAPWNGSPKTVWGVPLVETRASSLGTYFICGDFKLAELDDRQDSQIYVFEQHGDNAIRGVIIIEGVYRGAFYVIRPAAFVRGAGVAP